MSLRNFFFVMCLIVSVFCMAAGYWFANQWIGVALALLSGLGWLLAPKYANMRLPHVCLFVSVCLTIAGVLTGVSPLWMFFGSAAALAVWDLTLLGIALGKNSSAASTRQYETKHIQSLMLALGSGLIAALLGRSLNVQIPFFVLILLIAFILFALDRVWGYIKQNNSLR